MCDGPKMDNTRNRLVEEGVVCLVFWQHWAEELGKRSLVFAHAHMHARHSGAEGATKLMLETAHP